MTDITDLYEVCPHGHWICKKCGHTAQRKNEHRIRRHVREEHVIQQSLGEVRYSDA